MTRQPMISLRRLACVVAGMSLAATNVSAQVNAQLSASRTSGVAPLAVFFDASASTASGVAHPFHNLNYRWDFDHTDVNSADPVWALTGLSKEHATGPVAAHVFEVPGTYTVRLEVENAAGQINAKTVQITVQNPDTVYSGTNTIVFANAPGNFGGKPTGAQEVVATTLNQVLAHLGDGKRLLLRRGDTFTTTGKHGPPPTTNVTLGAFGPGSTPPLIQLTANQPVLQPRATDWRIMDLRIAGPGSGTSSYFIKAAHQNINLLFLRNSGVPGTLHGAYEMGYNHLNANNQGLHDGVFIVDNDFHDIGFGQAGNHLFLAARRLAILGNDLEDSLGGEHIIRAQHIDRGVISNNRLADQNLNKNVLTIRSNRNNPGSNCSAGCGEPTRKVVVSDNLVFSSESVSVEATTANSPTSGDMQKGENIIFERNFITNTGGASDRGVQVGIRTTGASSYVTIRNNTILMKDWQSYRGIDVSGHTEWVYNNSFYSPTADTSGSGVRGVFVREGGSNQTVFNNLLYAPNATKKFVVTGTATPVSAGNNVVATSNPFASGTITGPEHFALHSSSQARNQGAAVPVFFDYALNERPAEGVWDVGAYEFLPTGGGGGPIAVTSVSVSPGSLNLTVGQSANLAATVLPSNATNKSVTWSSSNAGVASVSASGVVTAHAVGSATITVTTVSGNHTATGSVSVSSSGGGGGSTTETFESLSTGNQGVTSLTLGGYTYADFRAAGGALQNLHIISTGGTKALRNHNYDRGVRITRADAGDFNLISLKMGSAAGGAADATVTGYNNGVVVGSTVITSNTAVLNTFTLNLNGVDEVTINFSGGMNSAWGFLDDIVLSN